MNDGRPVGTSTLLRAGLLSAIALLLAAGAYWTFRHRRAIAAGEEVFDDVELGSLTSSPCSPREPDPRFRGILISAPSKVAFGRGDKVGPTGVFAAIPICGFYMLDMVDTARPLPGPLEAMRLTARNKRTGTVFSGSVVDPPPSVRDEPPETRRASRTRDFAQASGGYFHPNLAERVPIPPTPGTYDVVVELRDGSSDRLIRSNVKTIEIVEEP